MDESFNQSNLLISYKYLYILYKEGHNVKTILNLIFYNSFPLSFHFNPKANFLKPLNPSNH